MATLIGYAYPLEIDPATGGLKLQSDVDLIADHILSWLETEPNERVMNPAYGTASWLFQSISDVSAIAALNQERLTANVPQATFNVLGDVTDQGEFQLDVYWAVPGLGEQEPITVVL
jgi:hypothetical protein